MVREDGDELLARLEEHDVDHARVVRGVAAPLVRELRAELRRRRHLLEEVLAHRPGHLAAHLIRSGSSEEEKGDRIEREGEGEEIGERAEGTRGWRRRGRAGGGSGRRERRRGRPSRRGRRARGLPRASEPPRGARRAGWSGKGTLVRSLGAPGVERGGIAARTSRKNFLERAFASGRLLEKTGAPAGALRPWLVASRASELRSAIGSGRAKRAPARQQRRRQTGAQVGNLDLA